MSIFICLCVPSLKCKAKDQIPLRYIKSIKDLIPQSKISRSVIRDKITPMSHRLSGFSDLLVDAGAYVENNKTTVVIAGGVTLLAGFGLYMQRCKGSSSKPGTFDIGSGSVDRSKVRDEVRMCLFGCLCA